MAKHNKTLPIAVSTAVAIVFGYYFGFSGGLNKAAQEIQLGGDVAMGECVRAGCSGQLCLDENDVPERGITTCEFREEYACYNSATCERQASGECGWTMTADLVVCLE